MRRLALGLALLLAQSAVADEGWVPLKADALHAALTARTLAYANGATQRFDASGGTDYDSGTFSAGRWRIEGDRYCSVWPPSEHWACYDVELSATGLDVRFLADDGSATVGRYIDLK